jgi:formylglycine-generating enzyme
MKKISITIITGLILLMASVQAQWVVIDSPGNLAQDDGNRDHTRPEGDGRGAVDYTYRIAKHAVTISEWSVFYNDTNSNKLAAGTPTAPAFSSEFNHWNDGTRNVGPNAPAVRMNFHHAAQYANWLTTGDAQQGAYTISSEGLVTSVMSREAIIATGNLYYLLPTNDEWFKAAYYDAVNEKYFLFAHGSDTAPAKSTDGSTDWNYDNALNPISPWSVFSGSEELNGTLNMMGNVREWSEDLGGIVWGGTYNSNANSLRSSNPASVGLTVTNTDWGVRLVAIPEPATMALLLGLASLGLLLFRRVRK